MKMLDFLNGLRIVLVAVLVSVVIFLCFVLYEAITEEAHAQDENQELDLFYMYGNRTGSYFLEPKAEYENLIYVSQSDLNDWDISPTETGQKFTGIFDPTGWDLITLKHKEDEQ